ncbi:MAG: tRNA pseudouridine(38-40) synthase TruA [Oscillospiraceae bacterium]|nr:tRNA pseudouridine(38-40) synthase TruA [Oscillospiraceae bacterium]
MRNLKVIISFNGANYHGFQIQNNAPTIQAELEIAAENILKAPIGITGCGRTDAGVHARAFCFNMWTERVIPHMGFVKAMNGLLPPDIAVLSCEDVDDNFHARYNATSKEYSYLIHNGSVRDVFMRDMSFFYPKSLNEELMAEAAKLFIGIHDFSAYCKAESLELVQSKKYGTFRKIYDFTVKRKGEYVELTVTGNGFLHNMVRIMAGTLVYVSEGKRTIDDVRESLAGGKRELAGVTLPPQGLYLNKVDYEPKQPE